MSVSTHAPGIRARLAAWDRRVIPELAGQRRASVAVVLVDRADEAHVVVIKRVARGRNAGQWALPGGRREPGEDAIGAALREAAEEIALEAGAAQVLGLLDDVEAINGFVITPVVVAVTEPVALRRQADEIASIHPIPLVRLTAPGVSRWKTTPEGPLFQLALRHDMVVHAPTGAILWQFAEVGVRGRPCRTEDVRQPEFVRD